MKTLSPLLAIAEEDVRHIIGNRGKVIDDELFQGNYAELANKIRKVVLALEELGDQYTIHEFDDEIDRETLFTIMEDSDR